MKLQVGSVTPIQLKEMQSALGLGRSKKPYRNRFQDYTESENWQDLVAKGFATQGSRIEGGLVMYYLTHDAVTEVYGKLLSKAEYDEL